MRRLGCHAEPLDPRIEEIRHHDYQAKNSRAALAGTADVFVKRGAYDAPALRAAIADVQPDGVIVDINAWGAAFAAEQWAAPGRRSRPIRPHCGHRGHRPSDPGWRP